MSELFFYGTLRHTALLQIVLGRTLTDADLVSGYLPDFAVCAVPDQPFPSLVPQKGARASGILVRNLTQADIARLDFYEGGFDYDLINVVLEGGQAAQVYVCPADRWQVAGEWDFEAWCVQWGALSCHAAREVMGHYGTLDRAQVAQMFTQIRARAWSQVLGGQTAAGQDVLDGQIEIAQRRCAYTGYFAVDEVRLRHAHFEGGMSDWMERSFFIAGDAALVLPYDPVRDCVLVVEQMRMGPLGRNDTEIWHLEPIAGRIDPGESAEQTAVREAREEAGLDLGALEMVARGYPSPGDSTGYFHIFVGITDLPPGIAGIGGLETEAENIRSRLLSFDSFMQMAERQSLANTPLALLAYWLAFHRSRLRSA
jgi:nudix-type nucleoside diphosphatase (YffH/AdpP family)